MKKKIVLSKQVLSLTEMQSITGGYCLSKRQNAFVAGFCFTASFFGPVGAGIGVACGFYGIYDAVFC